MTDDTIHDSIALAHRDFSESFELTATVNTEVGPLGDALFTWDPGECTMDIRTEYDVPLGNHHRVAHNRVRHEIRLVEFQPDIDAAAAEELALSLLGSDREVASLFVIP